MSRGRFIVTAGVVLLSLMYLGIDEGVGQPAPDASPPTAARIGVVNLEHVFQESAQKARLEQQLKKELGDRLGRLEKLEGDIKKVQQSMALVEAGSEQHLTFQEDVVIKQAKLKLYDERFRGELQAKRLASFDQIYAEIRAVTAQVANEMQLDLVFQQTLTVDEKMPAWESVLFARPQFDISQAVLQKLNTN